MTDLTLIQPHPKYQNGFDFFYENYKESGEKMVPFVLKFYKTSFKEYVSLLKGFTLGIGVPDGFIEHSTFWLRDSAKSILGVVNIRHRLNDSLRREGGHIGYGVAPMYRKKGYATEMLRLAIIEAQSMGIANVLVTCDKENIPSAKVAQKNGGVLETEGNVEGHIVQRYWFKEVIEK